MKNLTHTQRVALVAVIAVVTITGIIFWIESDNTGTITPQNEVAKPVVDTSNKQFNGQFISFEYSAQYVIREQENRSKDLEIYDFDANKPYPKKISVSVSDLPDGTLNSNSAYLLRRSYAEKFYERQLPASTMSAEVWSSTDGTKQTVFIVKDGRVAVLAFTQDGGDKTLYNAEVDTIVQSFKWK